MYFYENNIQLFCTLWLKWLYVLIVCYTCFLVWLILYGFHDRNSKTKLLYIEIGSKCIGNIRRRTLFFKCESYGWCVKWISFFHIKVANKFRCGCRLSGKKFCDLTRTSVYCVRILHCRVKGSKKIKTNAEQCTPHFNWEFVNRRFMNEIELANGPRVKYLVQTARLPRKSIFILIRITIL